MALVLSHILIQYYKANPYSTFCVAPRGVSACRARAEHRFGPLLIWSPNPHFLHGPLVAGDMDWPLSSWGYGLALFQLGIWIGPFPVGDMDWSLSSWGYVLAPFWLGMWTRPCFYFHSLHWFGSDTFQGCRGPECCTFQHPLAHQEFLIFSLMHFKATGD